MRPCRSDLQEYINAERTRDLPYQEFRDRKPPPLRHVCCRVYPDRHRACRCRRARSREHGNSTSASVCSEFQLHPLHDRHLNLRRQLLTSHSCNVDPQCPLPHLAASSTAKLPAPHKSIIKTYIMTCFYKFCAAVFLLLLSTATLSLHAKTVTGRVLSDTDSTALQGCHAVLTSYQTCDRRYH